MIACRRNSRRTNSSCSALARPSRRLRRSSQGWREPPERWIRALTRARRQWRGASRSRSISHGLSSRKPASVRPFTIAIRRLTFRSGSSARVSNVSRCEASARAVAVSIIRHRSSARMLRSRIRGISSSTMRPSPRARSASSRVSRTMEFRQESRRCSTRAGPRDRSPMRAMAITTLRRRSTPKLSSPMRPRRSRLPVRDQRLDLGVRPGGQVGAIEALQLQGRIVPRHHDGA